MCPIIRVVKILTLREEEMRRSLVSLVALGLLLAGCGKIQVTVEIRGGDGKKIRLDANDLQYKFNRLVQAGTFVFPTPGSGMKLKKGAYTLSVVAEGHVDSQVLELDSPPISGVENYTVTFTLPAGANAGFEREGTILYAATRTNLRNWDLFTIRADGSGRRRLTDTREFEQHPSWSPDGKRIAFTRGDVMTNIDIYAMDVDDGSEVRLTEHPERDQRAAWSPDGSKIAFVSQRDGDVAVWIMDADGSNKRKVVQGREPSWSPDGSKIAFTSGQFEGWDEIYVIDIDGSNLQRLTVDKNKFDWFPVWSPDGGRIAFDSERFGGQELMVMKADGSAQTRITIAEHSYEQEPVWSPDGKGLAYSGKMTIDASGKLVADEQGRPEGTYDIYLVAATGFDLDDVDSPSVLPINLTGTDDWNEVSPSWRSF
jgi:Tol biopolymer transport system component